MHLQHNHSLTFNQMWLFLHLTYISQSSYHLATSIKANCWCVVIPPAIDDCFTISSTIIRSSCVSGNCYPASEGGEAWALVGNFLFVHLLPYNTFPALQWFLPPTLLPRRNKVLQTRWPSLQISAKKFIKCLFSNTLLCHSVH